MPATLFILLKSVSTVLHFLLHRNGAELFCSIPHWEERAHKQGKQVESNNLTDYIAASIKYKGLASSLTLVLLFVAQPLVLTVLRCELPLPFYFSNYSSEILVDIPKLSSSSQLFLTMKISSSAQDTHKKFDICPDGLCC